MIYYVLIHIDITSTSLVSDKLYKNIFIFICWMTKKSLWQAISEALNELSNPYCAGKMLCNEMSQKKILTIKT